MGGIKIIIPPINEKHMTHNSKHYTLCQVLREIYQLTDDPEIKLKCRIASRMGKIMAAKISKYELGWEETTWPYKE